MVKSILDVINYVKDFQEESKENQEQMEKDKLEELAFLFKNNITLKNEVLKLEKANLEAALQISPEKVSEEMPTLIEEDVSDDILDETTDDVRFYIDDLLSLTDINMETVREALPNKSNLSFIKLINLIKLEIKKEIKDIQEFLMSEIVNIKQDDLKLFNDDITRYTLILNLIDKIVTQKEIITEDIQQNKLVFLQKEAGNIYVFDDLKNVSEETYPAFLELFESIQNGTFKSLKYFNKYTDNKFSGVWEVRGYQVRVIFDRLDKHTYAIIALFVKKVNHDKAYSEFMRNRVQMYRLNEKYLKEQIKNQDFIISQDIICENLFGILGKKNEEVNLGGGLGAR